MELPLKTDLGERLEEMDNRVVVVENVLSLGDMDISYRYNILTTISFPARPALL
jgi:hypothetical protein